MPHRLILISRWRVEASASAVWPLLANVQTWPAWWPVVQRVERSAASPLGDLAELHWGSALPCAINLRLKTVGAERLRRLAYQAQGRFQGLGIWLIEPAEGGWVSVSYRWEVTLDRPWMRALSLLLRPMFDWNLFRVMRAAAISMGRQLRCRVEHLSEWTGGHWP